MMRKFFNRSSKNICLTAVALLLVLGVCVAPAMAYFTTYTTSKGNVKLELGFVQTEIEEQVVAGKKEIILQNTGASACYVRMIALTGDAYKDSILYSEPAGGDGQAVSNWTPGADGYYYYRSNGEDIVLVPGESTTQINVSFAFPEEEEPADFNVIIIQECTPVLYDEQGNPYADWSIQADVSQTIVKEEAE